MARYVAMEPLKYWGMNAARNLLVLGLAALNGPTASFVGCEACGEEGSGSGRKIWVKPASTKQESSSKTTCVGLRRYGGTDTIIYNYTPPYGRYF